jgi:hypothetical protein
MKAKLLIFFLLVCLLPSVGWGQLPAAYQGKQITLRNVQSGMHMESNPSVWGNSCYQNYSNVANAYSNQGFVVENGVAPGFYRLRHLASGKYVTVIESPGFAEIRDLGSFGNSDNQEFEFVQQPTAYWYKLRAHFSHGGVREVLCINNGAGFNDGGIKLQANKTVGDDTHQRWYLTILNPDADPSLAIPTLEDRFENRTIGFLDNQRGFAWKGEPNNSTANDIYATSNYPDFAAQFRLRYTDEPGWYYIIHKSSDKFVTVTGAYDGHPVRLRAFHNSDDQKFKFIWKANGKYEIHSKYTQGPELGNDAALLLQVHPTNAGVQLYLGIDNTAGANSDGWQLFTLVRYENPAQAAEFNGGASTLSGKITGKQYHISARETLAMLEPYIVGTDTFVRTQQTPVYGEQCEWVLDPGRTYGAILPTYRIRYGKTGQYLYLPSDSETSTPGGLRLKLKSATGQADNRFEFLTQQAVPGPNWTEITSRVGDALIHTDDEGFMETSIGGNPNNTYVQDRHFCFNLAIPIENHQYVIVTKASGQYMTDGGVIGNPVPVFHSKYADYASLWEVIPTISGNHLLRNQLTRQFLTSNGSMVAGTQVYAKTNSTNFETQWRIIRKGNFYNFQNVASNKYLALSTLAPDGDPVYQGESYTAGVDWIMTRADYPYFADPELLGGYSPGILENYSANPINCLNDSAYKDKMMKNLGLPFEPSLQVYLNGSFGYQRLEQEGFATDGSAPSFLPVIKSALMYSFNYTGPRADSAIRNYKLDSAGHRIDVTYALKKYIIENLATRGIPTWTASETALVTWLEREVKEIRANYANRLETSWENYKTAAQSSVLTFDALIAGPINTSLFTDVDYYSPNIDEQISISEYAITNRGRNYKNPGTLAALTIPSLAGGGFTLLLTSLAKISSQAIVNAASAVIEANLDGMAIVIGEAQTAAVEIAEAALPAIQSTEATVPSVSNIASSTSRVLSVGNVGVITAVAIIAIEILVTRALEVAEYVAFENDLYDKINRNRNEPISIQNITQLPGLLEKIALNQDLDYILSTGERFDDLSGVITYVFNGDGNWSNAANWLNGIMPPNPLPANKEIIINPVSNGSCILDIPYTISAQNTNSRIKVKPFKNFVIAATLTVPSARLVK